VELHLPAELRARFERARQTAIAALLAQRGPHGHWEGWLSSSALSTATAVVALELVAANARRLTSAQTPNSRPQTQSSESLLTSAATLVAGGLRWLAQHQNADGGWGDTTRSFSNISTTTLGWAAFGCVPGAREQFTETIARAEAWLTAKAGGVSPEMLAPAITARYGKDRTFSAPILTMCALAGRLGPAPDCWRWVMQLPFELAAVPHQLYGAIRLPVVSYALPALIAIGQVRHHQLPSERKIVRRLRDKARAYTLRILDRIQPDNGGFLEATPLTSFVTMSLAGMGLSDHPVVQRAVEFLVQSVRPDGSWPIDTNLATWVTTLAINALAAGPEDLARALAHGADAPSSAPLPAPDKYRFPGVAHDQTRGHPAGELLHWLLDQQHKVEHPYTHAAPGGWAWTDLPGGVPDADDTPGAILAVLRLAPDSPLAREAAAKAAVWLLHLQNRDGGIPTFCRGWGTLPFDRSSPDLTAHTLRAWLACRPYVADRIGWRLRRAIPRAVQFLRRTRQANGTWIPLWFGHQESPDDENPLYGTARVLSALAELQRARAAEVSDLITPAVNWLIATQQPDGGWAGAPGAAASVEETALAVEALTASATVETVSPLHTRAIERGTRWLIERIESGAWREPAPIGFYFARLWYYETLYPLIFTVGALNSVAAALRGAKPRA
jgi:squalene-hopene/tetraprenyl-beta-curcumene cyclase